RPGLAEAGNRAVDQTRIARAKHRVVDPQPLGDARAEFLDHHVGPLRHPQEDLAPRPALEVEPDRFLIAPERTMHPEAGPAPLGLARRRSLLGAPAGGRARLLDLDDIGAKIAEDHRAMRTGSELGKVDYFDPAKRCD